MILSHLRKSSNEASTYTFRSRSHGDQHSCGEVAFSSCSCSSRYKEPYRLQQRSLIASQQHSLRDYRRGLSASHPLRSSIRRGRLKEISNSTASNFFLLLCMYLLVSYMYISVLYIHTSIHTVHTDRHRRVGTYARRAKLCRMNGRRSSCRMIITNA